MPVDNAAEQSNAPIQPAVRLKLVMPDQDMGNSPSGQSEQPSLPAQPGGSVAVESTGSPERPSYSPVTPTLSQASLTAQDEGHDALPPSQWMDEPEPVPLSLDENSDAIALRAALSILQIQRQQALRDMRDLDRMKDAALADPEQFVKDLEQGKMSRASRTGLEDEPSSSADLQGSNEAPSKFGKFPSTQNIVRAPPVEWAKYHLVGEPLDRLHAVQQHYPGFTESMQSGPDAPQPHEIAAPYRPFLDRLDQNQSHTRNQQSGTEK